MAISGISSFNYQTELMLNRLRWSNSSSKSTGSTTTSSSTDKTSSSSSTSTYSSTGAFLTSYQKELLGLESAAAKLQATNSKNVFNDYKAASTNEDVATVKGNWRLNGDTEISLNVQSLAQAQKNVSDSHYSQEKVEAGADMNLKITGSSGLAADISVSSTNKDGSAKTYNQMYQDAAKEINANSQLGVRATVENVDGKVSLVLTAKNTGEKGGFTVEGEEGAAAGIKSAALNAQDAVYSVTEKGNTQTFTSSTNKISLDYGRIDAELKSTGDSIIYTGVDEDDVVSAVKDLVDSYNSVSSMLSANSGRGIGVASHLESFKRGMADEKTLNAIGISFDKNGKMQLDEDKLKEALETDYEWTKNIISGQYGIAEKAAAKADKALSDSVQSIVDKDLSTGQSSDSSNSSNAFSASGINSSSFQYFASFARGGAFNLSNYYAVGMLLNTLA
ncbi:MAG: flagellar filament capping protein FliD [Lachnospiraceae bacterium]|nr:flagellar filament capping protein FliD [Lachnospiraceae bacterium]